MTIHRLPRPTPRIDVHTMRLFIAVAEEGSIARAAKRESTAPSALSRRMADLEHAFQVPLLVRSARGIELTHAGQHVFKGAKRIEQDLDRLVHDVWSLGGTVSGKVRLCANPSAAVGYLPERLRTFTDSYPKVSVEIVEMRTRDVLRACADDRADVGVAVAMDASSGLDSWHFASDPLIVVMPAGHPLALSERITFKQVLDNGVVGIQAGGALDQLMHEKAQEHDLDFQPKVSVNGFDTACRMVEAGLGIAVVPTSAATAFAGSQRFHRRQLDEPWSQRELRIYAPRKNPAPLAVEALIEVLRSAA